MYYPASPKSACCVGYSTEEDNKESLIEKIEQYLSEKFDYQSKIVLLSIEHLHRIVDFAPKTFGDEPSEYKYNMLFIKETTIAQDVYKSIRKKEGVGQIWIGEGVLYFSQLKSKVAQSYLSQIASLPVYKEITIHNWNTTTKLLLK